MDDRERYNDPEEALRAALEGWQAGIWTAAPGIVQSFNSAEMTVEVQLAIRARVAQPDGSRRSVQLPLLLDCPVVFPQGGGFTLTFPIKPGDECLVVFASRCIDAWWQLGGVQEQAEFRLHDLSDGFAILGVRSQPRVIPSINSAGAQLRSDDGLTFVEVDGAKVTIMADAVEVNCATAQVNASASMTVDSPAVTFTGDVDIQGSLTSEGTVLHTHTHGGVQSGSGSTGAPN